MDDPPPVIDYYEAAVAVSRSAFVQKRLHKQRAAVAENWKQLQERCDLEKDQDAAGVLKLQILALYNELGNRDAHIAETLAQEQNARQAIRTAVKGPPRAAAKAGILKLGMELDSRCTLCMQCLGRFYMRTPAFFQSVLGVFPEGQKEEDPSYELPAVDALLDGMALWEVLKHIDILAASAVEGDGDSVLRLLAILTNEHMDEDALSHLCRIVIDRWDTVSARDQWQLREAQHSERWANIGWKPVSAFVLNCPLIGEALGVYKDTIAALVAHSKRKNGSSVLEQVVVDNYLRGADMIFEAACLEDLYLELCPAVMEALMRFCDHHLVATLEQEHILFRHADTQEEEAHWGERRIAAKAVADMAYNGNIFACQVVLRLVRDEHWIIRHHIVPQACAMLARGASYYGGHDFFHMLMEETVEVVYNVPKHVHKSRHREQVPQDEELCVQKTAEEALCKEISKADAKTRTKVLEEMDALYKRYNSNYCNQVRDRVRAKLSVAAPKSASGYPRQLTMRKDRERQAALDTRKT